MIQLNAIRIQLLDVQIYMFFFFFNYTNFIKLRDHFILKTIIDYMVL